MQKLVAAVKRVVWGMGEVVSSRDFLSPLVIFPCVSRINPQLKSNQIKSVDLLRRLTTKALGRQT